MLPIVLLGSPGSGKGTQGTRLAEYYNIPHISTGEILRDHVRRGTVVGWCIKETVAQGLLVPDELMTDLVTGRLKEDDCKHGYILDGFPRTLAQAQWFYAHYRQPFVFLLDVAKDEVLRRIAARGQGRPDDAQSEIVLGRIREYEEFTAPLIGYYQREGNFQRVDGTAGVEATFDAITNFLVSKEAVAYG